MIRVTEKFSLAEKLLRLQIFAEPIDYLPVPEFRILRLQNPATFVGKINEFRRNVLTLQRPVKLQTLADGNAVIEPDAKTETLSHTRLELVTLSAIIKPQIERRKNYGQTAAVFPAKPIVAPRRQPV